MQLVTVHAFFFRMSEYYQKMAMFQRSERFFSIFNRHCLLICFFTMIILILINQIFNNSIEIQDQHCGIRRIEEYYMNNLR
jgi:hypothetical protein